MPTSYISRAYRDMQGEEGQVWPVVVIKNAHADNGGKQIKGVSGGWGRGRREKG